MERPEEICYSRLSNRTYFTHSFGVKHYVRTDPYVLISYSYMFGSDLCVDAGVIMSDFNFYIAHFLSGNANAYS